MIQYESRGLYQIDQHGDADAFAHHDSMVDLIITQRA